MFSLLGEGMSRIPLPDRPGGLGLGSERARRDPWDSKQAWEVHGQLLA